MQRLSLGRLTAEAASRWMCFSIRDAGIRRLAGEIEPRLLFNTGPFKQAR